MTPMQIKTNLSRSSAGRRVLVAFRWIRILWLPLFIGALIPDAWAARHRSAAPPPESAPTETAWVCVEARL